VIRWQLSPSLNGVRTQTEAVNREPSRPLNFKTLSTACLSPETDIDLPATQIYLCCLAKTSTYPSQ